ncbi:MAG: ATP-binding protein [Paracoccaceae bacterium]
MVEVYRYGVLTAAIPMLAVLPILGTVIGGIRLGLAGIGLILVAMIALAWLTITNEIMPPVVFPGVLFSIEEWATRIVNLGIAAGIGVFVIGSFYRYQQSSNEELGLRNDQLTKTRSRIAHSAELAGLGYALIDPKSGQVLECDNAYAEMHGLTVEQFTSLDIDNGVIGRLVHEDDREAAMKLRERLLKGERLIGEFRHNLPNGDIRSIRKIFAPKFPSGSPGGLFEVVSQDVTEARQLQEHLFQTQKMDSIGKLTGGVAHDFNNLLAVILGNLELLDDEVTDSSQKELIKTGIDATLRGSELTRNMLSFARKAPLAPTVVDLNQLVRNLKNWTVRTLPSSIEVETSLLAGLWPAEVDVSSAESGLLNLILNARDAMPGGGKLTIETSNVRIDEEYADLRGEEIEPGRYVLLAVSDTGEGIPPENQAKIFEPFFTTKPVGAGSGLGLSMLEGFMKQSGGTVQVYSELNVGTTFKLYFPAATNIGKQDRAVRTSTSSSDGSNRATILLVEDNTEVLAALRKTLVNTGYRVLDAASGDEALRVFETETSIDLLLTDIVMPGDLQGTTLAKTLRGMRPDLPVVFMSGYASEATVHGNGLHPEDIRLMKPVRREDLLRSLDRALSKSRGNGSRS